MLNIEFVLNAESWRDDDLAFLLFVRGDGVSAAVDNIGGDDGVSHVKNCSKSDNVIFPS